MPEDELNLKSLRNRFLEKFKEEYLCQLFEMVYDKYQEEFLLKFESYFEFLLESFKPEKRKEIDKDLFEFDFMNNICNYLNLQFLIYKISFEQKILEYGEYTPAALVYYNTEEERTAKEKKIEELSKENDEVYFIIYLEMELVRSLIDSLMLQPKTIMGMTQSKSEFISDHYETKLRSLQKSMLELKKDAEHGKKFKGKPLSSENEIMYQDILKIQEELLNQYGPGHISSLSNSVQMYSNKHKLLWDDKKLNSVTETIRILRKNKRI